MGTRDLSGIKMRSLLSGLKCQEKDQLLYNLVSKKSYFLYRPSGKKKELDDRLE